jgi:hypothetical protein
MLKDQFGPNKFLMNGTETGRERCGSASPPGGTHALLMKQPQRWDPTGYGNNHLVRLTKVATVWGAGHPDSRGAPPGHCRGAVGASAGWLAKQLGDVAECYPFGRVVTNYDYLPHSLRPQQGTKIP